MTFLVSPSVSISEFDLTLTVPAIAETPAAFAGIFRWGPMGQRILLGSPAQLIQRFFYPSNLNGETWFSAYSFLAYGANLYVVRAGDVTGDTIVLTQNSGVNAFSNGNAIITVNNTASAQVGMKLFYSSNVALSNTQEGGVYIESIANSTALILSSAPTANVGNVELIFRTNAFYNAFGQVQPEYDLQWADYNILNPNTYAQLANTFDSSLLYASRYPGLVGNSLKVAVCDTANQFASSIDLTQANSILLNTNGCYIVANVGSNTLQVVVTPANTANVAMVNAAANVATNAWQDLTVGDLIEMGNNITGYQFMQVTNTGIVTSTGNVFSFTIQCLNPFTLWANSQLTYIDRFWEFYNLVGVAPGQSSYVTNYGNSAANDQLHVVVTDNLGSFTGNPGAVLEVYKNVSRAVDALNQNGTTNYYATVINQQSQYVYWLNDRSNARSANAAFVKSSTAPAPLNLPFQFGDDGPGEDTVAMGTIINGYNYFVSPQDVDISLIITGKALGSAIDGNSAFATWLLNNIATVRKDCVVCCSPDIADVVNNTGFEADDIVDMRNNMPSTSYGFMDSGYKYMYDQFNNVYRWVPLNGDMAGLMAQTDQTNAPWWSPAGFNRGNVKNVVQLAWNPQPQDRDTLYTAGVNPVVTFPSLGTVLYGDKTLFAEPSAFNRINVRRLFIVLEKSIATAAQFFLFEFNDAFTRSQFVAMVTPFLQLVESQRGIEAFVVRCDTTNNPPQVVQNNEFVADIFITPNYSINWIKLNFVNVPPTISFSEAESIQY